MDDEEAEAFHYAVIDAAGEVRRSDGAMIPLDQPKNPATKLYQDWLAHGNRPDPYVHAPREPLPVPEPPEIDNELPDEGVSRR